MNREVEVFWFFQSAAPMFFFFVCFFLGLGANLTDSAVPGADASKAPKPEGGEQARGEGRESSKRPSGSRLSRPLKAISQACVHVCRRQHARILSCVGKCALSSSSFSFQSSLLVLVCVCVCLYVIFLGLTCSSCQRHRRWLKPGNAATSPPMFATAGQVPHLRLPANSS